MTVHAVLDLPPGPGNSRNSEGDFAVLKDGRILFAYSKFLAGTGADGDQCVIAARESSDKGETWSGDRVVTTNEFLAGGNVMSVSLLRLKDGRLALFYGCKLLTKEGLTYDIMLMRSSCDEGKTWGKAREVTSCLPRSYRVLNNARVRRLKSGRILMPLAEHGIYGTEGHPFISHARQFCLYSDDEGTTWKASSYVDRSEADCKRGVTFQEPGIVELKDGRVLLYFRTNVGRQYYAYSADGGATWGAAEPSSLFSPLSPATIHRLKTGELVCFWNDHEKRSELAKTGPKWASGVRTPLMVGVSTDDGKTWPRRRLLEDKFDPKNPYRYWYCYTAVLELDDRLLVAYCAESGLQHLRITSVPLIWLPLVAKDVFGGSSPFTVAKDGAPACVVVADGFAKPVAELTNYLHQITGAKFEVVKTVEVAKERPAIVFEKGEAVTDRDKFVVMQSYALRSSAKRLTLRSSHERGMLYGVYGLLRDHCGVRFYSPKFEVVPKNPSLTLDVDDVQKPAFRWRGYGWWDFKREWLPFFFKNRAGGLPTETLTSQHSLYTWVKAKENFKTHPEWFALHADGKRQLDAAMGICGTNPGVAAELAKNMVAWYRKNNPSNRVEKQILSIGHGDGWTPCLCKECVALSVAEGSETAPFILMMNRALEIARREIPDAQIITDAYFGSLMPPKTLKLNPGLWIDCTCGSIADVQAGDQLNEIEGTPANRWYKQALEGWAKLGDGRVTTYQWTDPLNSFYSEWPNFYSRCNDIRFISKLGVAGCLAEHITNPNWSCWARDYVWLSLMWNPNEDEHKLMMGWLEAYFGKKAAPILMRYVDYVEFVRKDTKYSTPTVRWLSYARYITDGLFDRATREKMDAILDEAVAAAKTEADPVYYDRVYTAKGGSIDELMLNGAASEPYGEVREPNGETWFVRGAEPKAPERIRRLTKFVREVDAGHKWDANQRLRLALPPHGGRADVLEKGASRALVVKDFSGQVVSLKVGGAEIFSQKKSFAGYRDTIPGAEKLWVTTTNTPACHAVTANIVPHPWYSYCGKLVFARTVTPTDDGFVVSRRYTQPKHDKSNRALPEKSRFDSSWIFDLPNPSEAGAAVVGGGVKGAMSFAGLDPDAKTTTVREKRAADMFSDAQVEGIDDKMQTFSASDRTFKFTATNGAVTVVFKRGDGVTVKLETSADGWESVTLKPDLATRTLEVSFSSKPWKGSHDNVLLDLPMEKISVTGKNVEKKVEKKVEKRGGGGQRCDNSCSGSKPSYSSQKSQMSYKTLPAPRLRKTSATTAVNEIDGMELVLVPAGPFIRGSDDPNAPRHERPRRRIEVSGFWIAKNLVTFAQLKKFAAATGRPAPTEAWPQTPLYDRTKDVDVVPANVSWILADAYAKWAAGRLPTEAEWMKAARGDKDARVYPWGDAWDPTKAVGIEMTYGRQRGGLAPVGMVPAGASPYGCLDMAGNAYEWVGDWYASDYWAKSPAKDPTGPVKGRSRVVKGGSYCFSEDHARIDSRSLLEPNQYDCMPTGFRYVIPTN